MRLCVCLHDRSVSVRAYRSVYGVVTLWEWTAIPVSDTENTHKPHWAATCIPIVTTAWHLPWPLTFDWSHVLSDCDTLACSCGSLTTGLIYPKLMGSLWAWHRDDKIWLNTPIFYHFLCMKQKQTANSYPPPHLSFNLVMPYFTGLPFRGQLIIFYSQAVWTCCKDLSKHYWSVNRAAEVWLPLSICLLSSGLILW